MPDHGRTHSYRMEELNAESELPRLEQQARLLRPMEAEFLDQAGLRPEHVLLDLGCGPCFFAEWAARARVPRGRVIGVDIDPALIALARGRGAPVETHVGSAMAIPLPDASVDFVYARFVFQHLDQPAAAIAEMRRVVRPGGIVAIADTDDGGLVLHPAPTHLALVLRASVDAQAARGGDRLVGRKLKQLLADAGLHAPRVAVVPLTSDTIGAAAFCAITLGYKLDVLRDVLPPAVIAEFQADLAVRAATPGFFGHALGYGAWGVEP